MADFNPSTEQQAILAHQPDQHAHVLAGPGTGKSATMVAWLGDLLKQEDAPKLKLLTFTRAATAELAGKVLDHEALAAEKPSTVHSFAISVLLRNDGYVAMTRATEYLFLTWARSRRGPTARSGRGRANSRRHHSRFLDGGPVQSQDGNGYLAKR